ncbi:alpha-D-ribose 1-methylphosphonate 5-triphosphate synthase subunit PhnH [Pseudochelatococcus lubricantis]|uniref:Alpha-D-ribose 1-methylphosphonate 5-triphosphate synthase subunit PhnH n=1 Tax=Pseudochelatococcus lubricantis TaxID=1538102 RepID=A0ABX0V2Q4_9HYPH|nr:phosphonate C-P lyase system protein PhnH [Pseudochelatococcus lubricantis]NIJ58500.1 alpha-D-ribose 1-methylphosphonate 5-triphosphate synthase subunit PhnH [Pseudochelatococcus lubricantis]
MTATLPSGAGFTDAVGQTQALFRVLMDAMARPGSIGRMPFDLAPPAPLTPELAAIALTMADQEASLWLDPGLSAVDAVARYLRFHTGAPLTDDPAQGAFALIGDPRHMPPLDAFSQGLEDYPDRSTTLVIAVEELAAATPDNARAFVLEGPGIAERAAFIASPLPDDFRAQLQRNRARFPRGVDCLFACAGRIAAIPRSSTIIGGV